MDVKENGFFDEANENKAPMVEVNEETTTAVETEVNLIEQEGMESAPSVQPTVGSMETQPVTAELPYVETSAPTLKLPFPPEDYNKKGNVKKLRGRMLKKLLKQEISYYLIVMLAISGLLLVSCVFLRFTIHIVKNSEYSNPLFSMTVAAIVLYAFSAMGGFLYASLYPVIRYNKNFFQNEGYLTFSIPASVEEHVFAKRIGAILCSLWMSVVFVITVIIAFGGVGLKEIVQDISMDVSMIFEESTGQIVLFYIEIFLRTFINLIMMQTLYGLVSSWLSNMTSKRKTIVVLLGAGLLSSVISGVFSGVTMDFIISPTVVSLHLYLWVEIIFYAACTVGGMALEIYYLKHKMDLK